MAGSAALPPGGGGAVMGAAARGCTPCPTQMAHLEWAGARWCCCRNPNCRAAAQRARRGRLACKRCCAPRRRAHGPSLLGTRALCIRVRDALVGAHAGDAGLSFTEGNAERLPFADASFDAYTIAFGIRNVTDRPAALQEALRVLKQGGRYAARRRRELRPGAAGAMCGLVFCLGAAKQAALLGCLAAVCQWPWCAGCSLLQHCSGVMSMGSCCLGRAAVSGAPTMRWADVGPRAFPCPSLSRMTLRARAPPCRLLVLEFSQVRSSQCRGRSLVHLSVVCRRFNSGCPDSGAGGAGWPARVRALTQWCSCAWWCISTVCPDLARGLMERLVA